MKLTGLRANNPVAVMAAYGALRLLPGARLRWAGTHPDLECDGDPVPQLAALLPQRLAAPENTLLDDPREKNIGGIAGYRALALQMPTEWLVALASEGAEGVRHTSLLLMGGRHELVTNAREVMKALAAGNIEDKLTEALIGPWRYQDRGLQAWGWDAAARIDAAASPKNVSSCPKLGVVGAYWLAWESLPLWPMINGRTVGMDRSARVYPTCAEWLGIEALRALIPGAGRLPPREAEALGVTLWSSALLRPSDYGKVLAWARPGSARTPSKHENAAGSRNPKFSLHQSLPKPKE